MSPQQNQGRWSDRAVVLAMGKVLRVGVALAALLVAAGGVAYLVSGGTCDPLPHFPRRGLVLHDPRGDRARRLALDPPALIALGLVVLVLRRWHGSSLPC